MKPIVSDRLVYTAVPVPQQLHTRGTAVHVYMYIIIK